MTGNHANISVFVPHNGCPHKCSFCEQHHISGAKHSAKPEDVDIAVKSALKSEKYNSADTEIAFFGGSFTAIDKEYMISLLETAYKYVKNGTVFGIRVSTRPDAINEDKLDILKKYGVTAVELGAQSMCDDVLYANERGHTAADVENAVMLLKEYGFETGLQMMTGLYKSNDEKDIYTAKKLISLKPDTVRIYPTITLENTRLAELVKSGEFKPASLENQVELCAKLCKEFKNAGITVIRVGLHSINENEYVGGPWHPAFGELCESRILLNEFLKAFSKKGRYNIYVNPKMISKAIGQKKNNKRVLKENGFECEFFTDEKLTNDEFYIKEV